MNQPLLSSGLITDLGVELDELLTIPEAGEVFAKIEGGDEPSYSTMMRRVHPKDPAKPPLGSVLIGWRRYTTLRAILQWIEDLNNGNGGAGVPARLPTQPKRPTPLQRAMEIERAHDDAIEDLGITPSFSPQFIDDLADSTPGA